MNFSEVLIKNLQLFNRLISFSCILTYYKYTKNLVFFYSHTLLKTRLSKIYNSLKKNPTKRLHLDTEYVHFFNKLKIKLKTAQIRANLAVNIEQIYFYWEMGKSIIYYQKTKVWGSKFLEQLSTDLRSEFPEMQEFSLTNLKKIPSFSEEYPTLEKGAQSLNQLPWSFIVILLHRIKDSKKRDWYVQETLKQGWSRTVLEMQIESNLFEH